MDEKLNQILKASFELFAKYGIRSVSMDDICKDMGISKKTLYQFVSSKEDLLGKMLDTERKGQLRVMRSIEKENHNAIDSLLEVSKVLSQKLAKISPNMAFDLFKYYPEIFKKHSQTKRKLLTARIVSNLNSGIKDGLYRKDLDVDLISQLYIKKIEDILDPEFWLKEQYSFEKIFVTMFENHIRGISNQQGIEYLEEKINLLNFKID